MSINWNLNREIAKLNYRIHNQLLVLANMESYNAILTGQGKTMTERLALAVIAVMYSKAHKNGDEKNNMVIKKIDYDFSICKVMDYSLVKLDSEYNFIGKTDEENSLVCITSEVPSNVTERDDGWKAFRIQGELDFSLIGILSKIAGILAENKISIFAISTFNTDYVLIKKENYIKAMNVLRGAGYKIAE